MLPSFPCHSTKIILLVSLIITIGCGGGGGGGGSTVSPNPVVTTSSTHVIALNPPAGGLGGTTLFNPLDVHVLDTSESGASGSRVTFTTTGGAVVTPPTGTAQTDGGVRPFVTLPNTAFQQVSITATADTGGSTTVTLNTGPRVVKIWGNAVAGSTVASDGRVFGRDALAADGTLLLRGGAATGGASVPESFASAFGSETLPGPVLGLDGKIYWNSYGVVQVLDSNLKLTKVIDLRGPNSNKVGQAIRLEFLAGNPINGVDSSGNLYFASTVGTVAKYGPNGAFVGLIGGAAGAINKNVPVLTPSGSVFSFLDIGTDTKEIAEILTSGLGKQTAYNDSLQSIVTGADNRIYISGGHSPGISVYDTNLALIATITPVDKAGNNVSKVVFGADSSGNMYSHMNAQGIDVSRTDAGGNQLWNSAVDPLSMTSATVYVNAANGKPISGLAGSPVLFGPTGITPTYWRYTNQVFDSKLTLTLGNNEYSPSCTMDVQDLVCVISSAFQPGRGIRVYDSNGAPVQTNWTTSADLTNLAIGPDGTRYSINLAKHKLSAISRGDSSVREFSLPTIPSTYNNSDVTVAQDGNLVVGTDSSVAKYSTSGALLWSTSFTSATSVTVASDSKNRVFVCKSNTTLDTYDSGGKLISSVSVVGCAVGGGGDFVYLNANSRTYQISGD